MCDGYLNGLNHRKGHMLEDNKCVRFQHSRKVSSYVTLSCVCMIRTRRKNRSVVGLFFDRCRC